MEDRKDFIEQIIGGVFGIIAVIAAILELVLGGFSRDAILGCVKDVFGTLAIIVLFFAILKDKIFKRNFNDRLQNAIDEWADSKGRMIERDETHDVGPNHTMYYSLDMKTDVRIFYGEGNGKEKGLFVRIPPIKRENYCNGNIEVIFAMNKGTFFPDVSSDDLTKDMFLDVAKLFKTVLIQQHEKFIKSEPIVTATKERAEISVLINHKIKSRSEIAEFISIIDTMYVAYLVSARLKTKKNENKNTNS